MTPRILGADEQPAADETVVKLQNTTTGTLHIGILNGEYLRVRPNAGAPTSFALTADQLGRYQRQIRLQLIYQQWFASGMLVDVTTPPPPPGGEGEGSPA